MPLRNLSFFIFIFYSGFYLVLVFIYTALFFSFTQWHLTSISISFRHFITILNIHEQSSALGNAVQRIYNIYIYISLLLMKIIITDENQKFNKCFNYFF